MNPNRQGERGIEIFSEDEGQSILSPDTVDYSDNTQTLFVDSRFLRPDVNPTNVSQR